MKTSPLTSISTKKDELAQWLKDNPEHKDFQTVWKDYNNIKEKQS